MEKSFLDVALEAVSEAGKIIMHYYADDIRATLKPDQSPVTVADTEAEQTIVTTIEKYFPNHGFLGEEFGEKPRDSEYLWIIDPIDGTKNYIAKIPIFGTLLALMKDEQLVLGVSHTPVLKETLYAERGKGAFMGGAALKVSTVSELSEASISFGGLKYFQDIGKMSNVIALFDSTKRQRSFGDLWQYHLLAQGKIDVVVEARLKFWDIAAAAVIVEEAGGKVSDINGGSIGRNSTTVIATNGRLHDLVVQAFK